MKRFIWLFLVCSALLSGCARRVIVAEVMQQGADDKLYTKQNIFYSNPDEISSLNFVSGNIIPYGTEIEIVECTTEKLQFKTASSEQIYTILFSKGERMASMQQYLLDLIGFEDRNAISKKIRPEFLSKVQAGEIAVGMTKDEVNISWGKVPPVHTPDERNMTWIYMKSHHDLIRLIFRGDVLRSTMPKMQDE